MATDEHGFRSKPFRHDKPRNRYRILLLGGSSTFGWATEIDKTYGTLVSQWLETQIQDKDIELLNTGVIGYSSSQARRLMETEGFAYNPDLVIFALGFNDSCEERSDPDSACFAPTGILSDIILWLNQLRFFQVLNRMFHQEDSDQPVARLPIEEYRKNIEYMAEMAQKIITNSFRYPSPAPDLTTKLCVMKPQSYLWVLLRLNLLELLNTRDYWIVV